MQTKYEYIKTPFLREIIELLNKDSPMRMIAVRKGMSIGVSTGSIDIELHERYFNAVKKYGGILDYSKKTV